MTAQSKSIVIYEIGKGKKIEVPIEKESVWLTQKQMSELFGKEVNTIIEHIGNIYRERELLRRPTTRKFRVVQLEGKRRIIRNLDHFNLDIIISVGYRVKSLRGTQFRIWATKTLRDYILRGYALNSHRIADTGLDELERAVNLIRQTLGSRVLTGSEAKGVLKVIADYAHSWLLMHKYDEGEVALFAKTKPKYVLTYDVATDFIRQLSESLHQIDRAAKFVGMERSDNGLDRIIGSINQTYAGKDLYKSVEEKAAHLLYFVIKDHPLIDGNKRSGSLLFIHYLAQNGLLFRESGERTINDNTIVALALLISQSHPSDKEIMIRLITNLLT